MIDRRQLVVGMGAVSLASTTALADAPASPAAKLNVLLDDFMQRNLRRSPEEATQLGLDKGALAAEKSLLDDRSLAQVARDKAETTRRQAELAAIDRKALNGMDAVNYDTVAYVQDTQAEFERGFDFGDDGTP